MADATFHPPTPERFAEHLRVHGVQPPSLWRARGPLALLLAALLVSLFVPGPAGLALPWIALLGVLTWMQRQAHRARQLQAGARAVQELAMLRRAPEALRVAWPLLPRLKTMPALHGRTIVAMAHCLDLADAHDAAIVGYDYLLERMPADHPGAFQLRVQRAISALFADRLSDADDALRRLRNTVERFTNTSLHAGFLLAELIQDVRTHHYEEALTLCDEWTAALRPLGVEAGFGHALVALCHHEARNADAARQHWASATTLLPPSVLLHKFPELKPLC